jgi:uncharacterized protein
MVRWRVPLRWYAVALPLPVGLTAAAASLNVLLGAQAPSAIELGGRTDLFSTFALILLVLGIGGAWEEPSWRGYALTRLQTGRSALFASLILGVLIAGWHLPLMVVGQVHYWDMGTILGAVVVFNWVFNSANGSVLIIVLMHAMNNTISGSFFSPMFTGADSVGQVSLLAAVWCAAAVVVVLWAGPEHLSRKHRKQEEPPRTESAASIASQTQDAREVLR